ncbi:MAG: hypothetical protein U0174_13800 [Polyangiaceae bacterium]
MRAMFISLFMLVGCASTTATTAVTSSPAPVQPAPVHPNAGPASPAPAAQPPAEESSVAQSSPAPSDMASSGASSNEDLAGLRAQVRARRAELTQCYAKTSAARSGRNGCVPVHFTLASDGHMKVSSTPKYASSDIRSRMGSGQCGSNPRLVDPALEACVAKVFGRIKVDQPRSTEAVEGIYPVYFASK